MTRDDAQRTSDQAGSSAARAKTQFEVEVERIAMQAKAADHTPTHDTD